MKRRLLCLLLSTICVFMIGCGSNESTTSTFSESTEQTTPEIIDESVSDPVFDSKTSEMVEGDDGNMYYVFMITVPSIDEANKYCSSFMALSSKIAYATCSIDVESSEASWLINFADGVQSNISKDEDGNSFFGAPSWYSECEDSSLTDKILEDYNNLQ